MNNAHCGIAGIPFCITQTNLAGTMGDHLDTETSVSVDLTATGVNAKAKSRLVAAIDRLGGNIVELLNAPMERRITRHRAISDGEIKLVEAVTKFGIEKLEHDPAFAQRVAVRYFRGLFQKQENKDGVLSEALEDLRHDPPNDAASDAGEAQLDEQFMGRFEHFAEGASTEQLRQKWGRVLSAEIRKPGTFSAKVLRVVDEIDANTAALFESVCASSFENVIPQCLSGVLPFDRLSQLVMADLLVEPGAAGHIYKFVEGKDSRGIDLWIARTAERAVSIPKGIAIPPRNREQPGPLIQNGEEPAAPIYLLTDVGSAIAQIFTRPNAFSQYIAKLKETLPGIAVVEYVPLSNGQYVPVST